MLRSLRPARRAAAKILILEPKKRHLALSPRRRGRRAPRFLASRPSQDIWLNVRQRLSQR